MNNIFPLTVSTDKLCGDEGYREYTVAEQLADSRRALQMRDQFVVDAQWWKDTMEGQNAVSRLVDEQLPRIMGLLDPACKEVGATGHYATQGILAALSIIQREAKRRATEEAEAIVERQ